MNHLEPSGAFGRRGLGRLGHVLVDPLPDHVPPHAIAGWLDWYRARYHTADVSKKKRLEPIRNNPRGVRFDDLVALVLSVGFSAVRREGSHAIYQHAGHPAELLNLQTTKDGQAKSYEVEQVLAVIDRCKLEVL